MLGNYVRIQSILDIRQYRKKKGKAFSVAPLHVDVCRSAGTDPRFGLFTSGKEPPGSH
jgi:hypothetical protein